MKTLYEKIFIKSEADLPKEDGKYIAHYKKYDIDSPAGTVVSRYNMAQKYNWMNLIDWYLKPLEEEGEQEKEQPFSEKLLVAIVANICTLKNNYLDRSKKGVNTLVKKEACLFASELNSILSQLQFVKSSQPKDGAEDSQKAEMTT